MKLEIGQRLLGSQYSDDINKIKILSQNDKVLWVGDFENEILLADLPKELAYLNEIEHVKIWFCNLNSLEFLKLVPNTKELWIETPWVKEITDIVNLKRLQGLDLRRPEYKMHVLGELQSLKSIFIGEWRAGAQSIAKLVNLEKAELHKMRQSNLTLFSEWASIKELDLYAGSVESLKGLPPTIEKLTFTSLRKLKSLAELSNCQNLRDLRIESCKLIDSLDGLEECTSIEALSLVRLGKLSNLDSLRNLKNLKFLFIGDNTKIENSDISVFEQLTNLSKLIITRSSGLQSPADFASNSDCEVRIIS